MAYFTNTGHVANQAGHQQVHGSMFNGTVNQLIIEKLLTLSPVQVRDQLEILDSEILKSLSFREMFDRRANLEQPFPKTCRWVLDNHCYKEWSEKSHGLLWVKGKPGAGKSVLMSWLYSELRAQRQKNDEDNLICLDFFFSARGAELQHTAIGMLRSLLNQMFSQDKSVREMVRRPYQEKCNAFGRNGQDWDWQRVELELLLQQTVLQSASKNKISIFIDALDEAGELAARMVAEYFHRINDANIENGGSVKICISCRHYPILSSYPSQTVHVEDHNHRDIARYIRHQLYPRSFEGGNESHMEWKQLEDSLIEQAKGVFQWVSLVVPMVRKAIDDGQSPVVVQRWLMDVPQELTAVYRHILINVISRRTIQQSLILFLWVLLAEEQVTLSEIYYLLLAKHIALDFPDDEETQPIFVRSDSIAHQKQQLRALSGGLIEVVEPIIQDSYYVSTIAYVQVIHQSVNDFLRQDGLSLLGSLQPDTDVKLSASIAMQIDSPSNVEEGHLFVYWTCLKYLAVNSEDEFRLPHPSRPTFRLQRRNRLLRLHQQFLAALPEQPNENIQSPSAFWNYPRRHVFSHARKSRSHYKLDHASEIELLRQALPSLIDCPAVSSYVYRSYPVSDESPVDLIHVAALAGLIGVVNLLIQEGDDVNQQSSSGYTALHFAAAEGNCAMFELLFARGADINIRHRAGKTPLMMAAQHGQFKIADELRKLLKDKQSSNDMDHGSLLQELAGEAIEIAVNSGSVQMVHSLLNYNFNVDYALPSGRTAMQLAVQKRDTVMVQYLMNAGADIDAATDGDGPLLQNVISKNILESSIYALVHTLLLGGAAVNGIGGRFGSALCAAIATGKIDIFRLLLASGADVNFIPPGFPSPIHLSIVKNQWYTVETLIQAGADVNLQAEDHGFPLEAAAAQGDLYITSLLLKAGADGNARGGKYGTALEIALAKRNSAVAPILAQRFPETLAYPGTKTLELVALIDADKDQPIASHVYSLCAS